MENLPEDIFENILFFLKNDIEPLDLYRFNSINKSFYKSINNIKNNYSKDYIFKNQSVQNKINRLFFRGNKKIFKWLFDNNVFFTENNILNLVENKRLDILKISIFYNPIIDVLFNDKYNVLMFNSERIIQHESPLILAGNKNNYDIVKFLIEINNHKNPFHSQLDILIENLLDKKDKSIIKYIITSHYDKLRGNFFTTEKILNRLNDCEDIIFYLMLSKKICINNKFIWSCIDKDYTEACIYAYKHISDYQTNLSLLAHGEHIERIMKRNNILLLDFFITKYPNNFHYVRKHLLNMWVTKEFFMHLFNNYLKFFDCDYPLIDTYLKYDGNVENIKNLVNNNYMITKDTLKASLDCENLIIFKIISEKYLKYYN